MKMVLHVEFRQPPPPVASHRRLTYARVGLLGTWSLLICGLSTENCAADLPHVSWTVSQPPEKIRFPENAVIQFTVNRGASSSSGTTPAPLLYLTQSSLQDAVTTYQLDTSELCICAAGQTVCPEPAPAIASTPPDPGACSDHVELPKPTNSLALRIKSTFTTAGTFSGAVSFALDGQSELQSFKLTVYSSSPMAKAEGVACILVGLLLYFGINVGLRCNANRDAALIPAYQLRDTVLALEARVNEYEKQLSTHLAGLSRELNTLDVELRPGTLKTKLPSMLTFWSGSSAAWLDGFKSYLAPRSDKTLALDVLITEGIATLIRVGTGHPAAAQKAIQAIDFVAPTVARADDARMQLSQILQAFQADISAAGLPHTTTESMIKSVGIAMGLPRSTSALQVRIVREEILMWCIVSLVSLIVGVDVLIVQDFGFGTSPGLLKCFFWGLGFSVAGTQLQQLTQSSVTGMFGINIPKT